MAILNLCDVCVKYGNVEALKNINIYVDEGEIVAILGANGAGKSTTLMAISGLAPISSGMIFFQDKPLNLLSSHEIVEKGITQSPEGRRVFDTLSVKKNLLLGAFTVEDKDQIKKTLNWIYTLFPRLKEREKQMAGTLSGGEQQMLAIGRALMGQPKILLLDEPSLGLAPLLVKFIFKTIRVINDSGVSIVLVEQNARASLDLASRAYVLEVGKVVMEDLADNLLASPKIKDAYLGGMNS